MKKVNTFLLFILILLVIGCIVTGALYHFTDVIKVKSPSQDKPSLETPIAPDKPNDVVVNKELVSTTIVNETYGTFELSANSMILNFSEIQRDLLFENGTNFNYLLDETIALFNSFNLSEPLIKDDCVVGILAETGTSGKFIDDGYATFGRNTYLKLPKNTLLYPTEDRKSVV